MIPTKPSTQLAQQERGTVPQISQDRDVASRLMDVIASNPSAGAENLKALLDGLERVRKWDAETQFTAAFARLKFPAFVKHKKMEGRPIKWAPLEDIQEIIEPILAAEGFTLTFTSGEANAKGEIPTYGLLSHIGGHSRQGVIWLPPDATPTRSGSTTMNVLQQVGSSTSYGMRYCAKLMLNLRFIGEDDDANATGFLSERQTTNILDSIKRAGLDPKRESKFLEFAGAKVVSEIRAARYQELMTFLGKEIRKRAESSEAPYAEYAHFPDPFGYPAGARITVGGVLYQRNADGSAWEGVK